MKYIAFIVLGLVLLAAIGGVVLWANMPTAKLTAKAVGPMGTTVTRYGWQEREQIWPVMQSAITNIGRTSVRWDAYLHLKDSEREYADDWTRNIARQFGSLSPGESAVFEIGVPPDSTNWAVTIKYWPEKSSVEKRLDAWLTSVPKLRRLLPNDGDHFASDVWHTGTNVTVASDPTTGRGKP